MGDKVNSSRVVVLKETRLPGRMFLGVVSIFMEIEMELTRAQKLFVMAALVKRAFDERLYYVADCGEKGQGLFADEDIPEGEAIYHAGDKQENSYGTNDWEMTQAAMYTNHSRDPNCLVVKDGDKLFTVAKRDIPADEEISVSYFQVTNVIGPGSRLLHNNEPVPPKDASELAKWAADNSVSLFGSWTQTKKKPKEWYHSCCGEPSGQCAGCDGGSRLILKDEYGK